MANAVGADHDERLAQLIVGLTEDVRAGRSVDIEAVARAHPDLAEDLRYVWPAVIIAEEVARPPSTPTTAFAPADDSAANRQPAPPMPRRIGDYELISEIGRGGMGVVYKARQRSLGRLVALKMILNAHLATETEVVRFRTEAKAAARLDHPHIVPVYETGEHEGTPYFSMKYIDGPTLADLAAPRPLTSTQAARYLLKVAEAVQHAHDSGILHRDLKPSNVILDRDGEPHVTDFGLAKRVPNFAASQDGWQSAPPPSDLPQDPAAAGWRSGLTMSGAIMGTPSYMPPEQAAGGRGTLSPASDVYSLGAILYYLLTGRPPFQAAAAVDILLQVLEEDPLPPRLLNVNVDRDLELICLKCLQKPQDLRYSTARELANDLRAYLNGETISLRSGTFVAFASRLLRPTHHAPVLSNWGTLWMAHSVKVLIQCGLTAWLAWAGVTGRIPYLVLWGGALLIWSWIFWSLRKRSGPITFVERQVAHVWGSAVIASILLFFVEMLLGLPVLTLSPVLALLAGMIFTVKAGTLSGSLYFPALACFATALLMAALPRPVGILIFGCVVAASFGIPGLIYFRQKRLEARRS